MGRLDGALISALSEVSPSYRAGFELAGFSDRLRARAMASGFKHSDHLWSEVMAQVAKGWLSGPLLLNDEGLPPGFSFGEVGNAFRFPVAQADKIRACENLKYECANPFYGGRKPIRLPTWGRIGEMCLRIADADR